MVVAMRVPHNDGLIQVIITAPGFDSETALVDLYEVDASVKAFPNREEAEDWLAAQGRDESGEDDLDWKTEHVPGGVIMRAEY
jgi:hypothetical protein